MTNKFSYLLAASVAATSVGSMAIAKNKGIISSDADKALTAQNIGKVTYVNSIDEIPHNIGKGTQIFVEGTNVPISPEVLNKIEISMSEKYPEYSTVVYLRGKNNDRDYGKDICGNHKKEKAYGNSRPVGSKSVFKLRDHLSSQTNISSKHKYISIYISGIGGSGERTSERGMCTEVSPTIMEAFGGPEVFFPKLHNNTFKENARRFGRKDIGGILNNTIGYIDRGYNQEVQNQMAEKERVAERKRQLVQAKIGVEHTVVDITKKISQLQSDNKNLQISTHPQYKDIHSQLQVTKEFLREGKIEMSVKSVNKAIDIFTSITNTIKNHSVFTKNFDNLQQALINLQIQNPYINNLPEYQETISSITKSRQEHKVGNFLYLKSFSVGKEYLNDVKQEIKDVNQDIKDAKFMKGVQTGTGGLGILGLLGFGLYSLRKRKISEGDFNEVYDKLEKDFSNIKDKFTTNKEESKYLVEYLEQSEIEGKTKEKLNNYKDSFNSVDSILNTVEEALISIKENALKGFRRSKIINGQELLENSKITFQNGEDTINGTIEEVTVVAESTYYENIVKFEENLRDAETTKENILNQILSYKNQIIDSKDKLNNFSEDFNELNIDDFLKKLDKSVSSVLESNKNDSLGINDKISSISMTLYEINQVFKDISSNTKGGAQLYKKFDLSLLTEKIQNKYDAFSSGEVDNANVQVAEDIQSLYSDLHDFFGIISQFSILENTESSLKEKITALKNQHENKKNLFEEEGYSTTQILEGIANLKEQLGKRITKLEKENSVKTSEQINLKIEELRKVIELTEESLKSYESKDLITTANWKDMVSLGAVMKEMLNNELQTQWSLSQESLTQIGIVDGNLENNITTAEENSEITRKNLSNSDTFYYEEGKVIHAFKLLEESDKLNSISKQNLEQIIAYKDFLEGLDNENNLLVEENSGKANIISQKISEGDTLFLTKDTIIASENIVRKSSTLNEINTSEINDPYKLNNLLKKMNDDLILIDGKIEIERNTFGLYTYRLKEITKTIEKLRKKSRLMQSDSHPESNKTDKVFINTQNNHYLNKLNELYRPLNRAIQQGEIYENDIKWSEKYEKSIELTRLINEDFSLLKDDEKDRERAYDYLEDAVSAVKKASLWSGRYTSISSYSYGESTLKKANKEYINGDFYKSIKKSKSVISKAESAIRSAQSDDDDEISRRRRAKEAAAKAAADAARAARRAAEDAARAARASSSSTNFGGGGGGWGGGGGGGSF